jgi:hypothetical protein
LRINVSTQRQRFIDFIMHAQQTEGLNAEYLSEQLEDYEAIAQDAVQGNIQLNYAEDFPVQTEKWTIVMAIFFASTICTTIGKFIK